MTHISIHTALVFGAFLNGVVNILFGMLVYIPLPTPSDKELHVSYLVMVILLRLAGGIGTAAVFSAAMALLAVTFPQNTTAVLVGCSNGKDIMSNWCNKGFIRAAV